MNYDQLMAYKPPPTYQGDSTIQPDTPTAYVPGVGLVSFTSDRGPLITAENGQEIWLSPGKNGEVVQSKQASGDSSFWGAIKDLLPAATVALGPWAASSMFPGLLSGSGAGSSALAGAGEAAAGANAIGPIGGMNPAGLTSGLTASGSEAYIASGGMGGGGLLGGAGAALPGLSATSGTGGVSAAGGDALLPGSLQSGLTGSATYGKTAADLAAMAESGMTTAEISAATGLSANEINSIASAGGAIGNIGSTAATATPWLDKVLNPKNLLPVAGGLLAAANPGAKPGSTTQTREPWAPMQPYLLENAKNASDWWKTNQNGPQSLIDALARSKAQQPMIDSNMQGLLAMGPAYAKKYGLLGG